MADRDPKVMAFVEQALAKDLSIKTSDLYEMAKRKFDAIGDLTVRQFHARYPLQVKRKAAGAKAGRKGRGAKKARGRSSKAGIPSANSAAYAKVRSILLDLIRDVAGAETKAVVDVVAGIDRHVDNVLKAAKHT